MFFFNWNSPKKNTPADDLNTSSNSSDSSNSNNSAGIQSMASNQPVAPAFSQPTSAFGSRFSTNSRFGGSVDSDDLDDGENSGSMSKAVANTADVSPYSNPYSALNLTPRSATVSDSTVSDSTPSTSAQNESTTDDYVDAYIPPQHLRHTPWTDTDVSDDSITSPVVTSPLSANSQAPMPSYQPDLAPKVQELDYLEEATRQQSTASQKAIVEPQVDATPQDDSEDQTLEAQNIFHLLGVEDGNDDEKESFLDELQQVVWEDFVEKDVALLLTESEYVEFKKIIDQKIVSNEVMQEEALAFLEKLIPDLEEILLEKAMELKRDMVMERIMGMKEFYANNPDTLQVISQVERLFAEDTWKDGADMLNTLK